jgi:hypothetical protein
MFADGATVSFRDKRAEGRDAIRQWHEERFSNHIDVRLDGAVVTAGESISAPVRLKSDRLEGRRLAELPATITIQTKDGLIATMKIEARIGAALKGLFGFGS